LQISASTFDEVIQLDPLELCFPSVPHKRVLSSFKIINVTESYVSFKISYNRANNMAKYIWNKTESVLPPRSTECLRVIREGTEDAVYEKQFIEKVQVYYAIVDQDIKACDLDLEDYNVHKKLPIVLTKVSPLFLLRGRSQIRVGDTFILLLHARKLLSPEISPNPTLSYIDFLKLSYFRCPVNIFQW
jgi:hypothetical protein